MARVGGAKPAPRPKPVAKTRPSGGSFVGLDIGTQTIKAVEVSGMGSGLKVTAFGTEATPPGAVQQGIITSPKELGAAIKKLLQKHNIRSRKVVSAVNGSAGVVVRVLDNIPKMTAVELAETMRYEVERHIPFSASDVEMSYQKIDDPAIDNDPNNPNMEVLLAVAQRELITAHLEALTQAGLSAVAVDVEPLAVGRALINRSDKGLGSKNVVIVNMGASSTEVGIFKSGVLRFPRTIPLGGDNLTRAIADRLGLTMDAAEDEKRANASVMMDMLQSGAGDYGGMGLPGPGDGGVSSPFDVDMSAPLPPPMFGSDAGGAGTVTSSNPFDEPSAPPSAAPAGNPFETSATPAMPPATVTPDDPATARRREVFNAILPILGEFSMELRRSIDYFRSKFPTETVDKVLLCGGSARIPNLDQYLQNDLGIPTEVGNPFDGVTVVARQFSAVQRDDMAPSLAVATGLAVRDAVLGAER